MKTNKITRLKRMNEENADTLRKWAKAQGVTINCPIQISFDDSSPKIVGERFHYKTKAGDYINHPRAYAKKGSSNMVYHHSTRKISVGLKWLAAN